MVASDDINNDDNLAHVQANVPPDEVPSVRAGSEIKIYFVAGHCGCR